MGRDHQIPLADLLARFLADGDEKAMEELVRRTQPKLLEAARRIAGSTDAEDAVQTAYHSLLRKGEVPRDAPLMAWLITAVVRIAYRRCATAQRQHDIARRLAQETHMPSGEREELARLRREVDRLPNSYRDAVVLHYLEGLSAAEAGKLLGVSEAAVWQRLHRARGLLRSRLSPGFKHGFMFLPWWLADRAAIAALMTGSLMQAKTAVSGVILLLFLLSGGLMWRATSDSAASRRAASPPLASDADGDVSTKPQAAGPGKVQEGPSTTEPGVRGVVIDAETHAPVAGALVVLTNPADARIVSPRRARSTITDANGGFAIAGEPDQPAILVRARGYLPALDKIEGDARHRIVLRRGVSISGRVVNAAGVPVPGARVWATLEGNRVAWPNSPHFVSVSRIAAGAEALTDANGSYELRGLSEDTPYALKCSKQEHTFRRWRDPPVVSAGPGPVSDLVLGAVCRLTVRAVDSEGNPVPNAELQFAIRNVSTPIDYQRGEAATAEEPEGGFLPDGWVRMTLARQNPETPDELFKVKVWCSAPGFARASHEVPLSEGAVRAEIPMARAGQQAWGGVRFSFRFRKSRTPFTGDLVMEVFSLEPNSRGHARVRVVDGQAADAVKLPLGRYRFGFMGFGDQGMWWTDAGRVALLDVTGPETPCDVELDGTPVHLTVRDPEGRLLRGYDMIVNPSRGRSGGAAFWDVPTQHSMTLRPTGTDSDAPDFFVPSGKVRMAVKFPGVGSFQLNWDAAGDGVVRLIDAMLKPGK